MTMTPKRFLILCFLALAALGRAWATTVLPLTLDDIVGTANVAFEATCIENRIEHDPQTNLIVTYTTFAVHDVIKGEVGATYTIKQVGGEMPGRDVAFKMHGIPTFTQGQDYIVFLPPASSAGFSSPVGLSQGRFTLEHGTAGARVANGRDFREMTANIPDEDLPPGLAQNVKHAGDPVRDMGVGDFKQLARGRAGKQR
jgi:hypothetical protein